MNARRCWLFLALALCPIFGWAEGMTAQRFVSTPSPANGELVAPRTLAVDEQAARCYVLDTGSKRIVAFTPDGQQSAAWSLDALDVDATTPADTMLPSPALAVGGGGAFILTQERAERSIRLTHIDGAGNDRVLALPDDARTAAVTLDPTGKLLVAFFVNDGKTTLTLAREGARGTFETLETMEDSCGREVTNPILTGFTMMADGRFAIGIAEKGSPAYSFIRSWLIQGTVRDGKLARSMRCTHKNFLLDSNGKVQERYRAAVALAGQQGYPATPCVPLFTSLVFGPGDTVISGGCAQDPFLRVYSPAGTLLSSAPRFIHGGQTLAVLPRKAGLRLLAIASEAPRINEMTFDGRVTGSFGVPMSFDLSDPVALAADREGVYALTKEHARYQLIRFTADGRMRWTLTVVPPSSMLKAEPVLTACFSDRVFIGWRIPKAAGLGWVDTVMEDGTPGIPLWSEPFSGITPGAPFCQTPLVTGQNGRIYVLRERKTGVQLQAFSSTGALLQSFPTRVQGVTAANQSGTIVWAKPVEDGMLLHPFSPQGDELGWKRVPRPARNARFLPAPAGNLWGWLTSTDSLLKLDDNFTVVGELVILDPNGNAVENVLAVAGDRKNTIYLALPGRILRVKMPEDVQE